MNRPRIPASVRITATGVAAAGRDVMFSLASLSRCSGSRCIEAASNPGKNQQLLPRSPGPLVRLSDASRRKRMEQPSRGEAKRPRRMKNPELLHTAPSTLCPQPAASTTCYASLRFQRRVGEANSSACH
ncbi:hypothetical protein B0T20DRAFT_389749 [Sordaria brevicollis]|uniref:Uncharacterized protein n=1 Tax=Sordaria brevicollis TaxID=83679 RepID=A0AAE0PKT6_SORBR|nr:hypothetical protein B0T20DRAFT_389749 [Sordaria brevicollis]